jgi:hypothetical protein
VSRHPGPGAADVTHTTTRRAKPMPARADAHRPPLTGTPCSGPAVSSSDTAPTCEGGPWRGAVRAGCWLFRAWCASAGGRRWLCCCPGRVLLFRGWFAGRPASALGTGPTGAMRKIRPLGFRAGGSGHQIQSAGPTCDYVYARVGELTSAPGCPKLVRACGGAGRRETADLAEDTPTKSRDGLVCHGTNWMCRPGRVADHRQVMRPPGTSQRSGGKSLGFRCECWAGRVRVACRSIRQRTRKR